VLVFKNNQNRGGFSLTRHGREAMQCVSFPFATVMRSSAPISIDPPRASRHPCTLTAISREPRRHALALFFQWPDSRLGSRRVLYWPRLLTLLVPGQSPWDISCGAILDSMAIQLNV
jgi:hypothetical protein